MESQAATSVVHNQQAHRYEIFLAGAPMGEAQNVAGQRIGFADYELVPGSPFGEIHFVHTEVDRAHQGKNYAAILTREALADVRAKANLKVVPVCSYTVLYMAKHPETQDLLLRPIEEAIAACRLPIGHPANQLRQQ